MLRDVFLFTRMWHSACSSGDGEVYLFGGSSVSVFVQDEVSTLASHLAFPTIEIG